MRYGREYGLGNSSSRSWVWAHFAGSQARCVTCARNRALPRPRDRCLGMQGGPTATPAFEQAFETGRARPSLLSSSASKVFFQCFYAPTGERLRAGSTTSTRTLTTSTTTSTSWITTPTRLLAPAGRGLLHGPRRTVEHAPGNAPRRPAPPPGSGSAQDLRVIRPPSERLKV